MALPLRDERRLEVGVRDRGAVAQVLRELERALDVVACGDVVAQPAVTARAPLQDVGAEQVARQPGTLGERRAPRRRARSPSRCSRACSGRPRAGRGRPRGRRPRTPPARRAPARAAAARSPPCTWPTSCSAQASPASTRSSSDRGRRALDRSARDLAIRLDRLVVADAPRTAPRRGSSAASTFARSSVEIAGRQERRIDAEPLGEPRDRRTRSDASCRARSG